MKRVLLLFLLFSVAVASYAATDYGIAVAGVRVTSDNKNNITGAGIISGSVYYDYAQNMLTLNNATIDVRNMAVNAITNDYGSRANFRIRLVGNNYIKINVNSIAINVKESQGFILESSDGTGILKCGGALYLDARDHINNDYTKSYIRNCTVYFGDILSEDYEECLTINNANVTTDYLNVGSDHNGQKGLTLIDCYLAYPTNGVVDQFGSIQVDGDFWHDHVEIKRGARHGDVNGDGDITAADVTALYDWLLNNDNTQLKYGDQNGDGDITAADVTEVYDVLLGSNQPNVTEYTVNGVKFKMVNVEGGTFMMGGTAEQAPDGYASEYPVHQVTLSSFSIGQTEVTQKLWQAVMGNNPSTFSSSNGYASSVNRPLENVSWYDCQQFITKLNQMTGKNFRLPTEAEWEFAARGGNKSQGYKYAGSNNIDDVAWFEDNDYNLGDSDPDYGTHTVGTKQPNELGIYDMSGNVWELCQDYYGEYSSEAQTNPTGPSSGSMIVFRGGSWGINARRCRVSYRNGTAPSSNGGLGYYGVRIAL